FSAKAVIRFLPENGSSHMEMTDIDGDGLDDSMYTSGDNYDYSRVLKNYHGIYIFLNKGKAGFVQQYFFPMHGCYKAIARDFDNDGDQDIASISFFADTTREPREAFIFLENRGLLKFVPYTIPV